MLAVAEMHVLMGSQAAPLIARANYGGSVADR